MPERVEPPSGQKCAVGGEVRHAPACRRGTVQRGLDGCSIVVLPVSTRPKVEDAEDLLSASLWQGSHHGGEKEAGKHSAWCADTSAARE
jgi:hypothetical protein